MSDTLKRGLPGRPSSYLFMAALTVALVVPGQLVEARKIGNRQRLLLPKVLVRQAPEYKAHNVGALWNVVTNYGSFGDPEYSNTGRPSMEWPGGKSNNYLYDASVMATTIINGEKRNTGYFYYFDEWEPSDGTKFLIGNDEVATLTPPKSIQDSWAMFDDLLPEADHFPMGIEVIRQGLSWSMPEFDDIIVYEFQFINMGLNGDLRGVFFSFWYDLDVASIDVSESHIDDLVDFDGWDGFDTATDEVDWVDPHDLDGDGLTGYDAYGWSFGDPKNVVSDGADVGYQPDKIERDGVYDEYTLLIDPNGPPVFADVDVTIGELEIVAGDSLRFASGAVVYGYKVSRGMSYMYDYDNPTSSDDDTGERSLNPASTGFVGGRVIYADPTEADYYFSPGDSAHRRIVRPFSHQWWNWESDPDNDTEFYDYITGQHDFSKGFMFLPNPLDVGAPTFDYRFLHSVGPYDLAAGDTVKVIWVEGIGEGLEGLRHNIDNALAAYYTGSAWSSPYNPSDPDEDIHWRLPAPPATPSLSYSPGNEQVKLVWDNLAEITPDTKTGKIDFTGYKVYRAKYSPSNWTLIHVMFDASMFFGDIFYITNTEGDTLGSVARSEAPVISNAYVDAGGTTIWGTSVEKPINGIPYYYALVAFDTGDPLTGLPPAESGRSNYKKNPAGAPVATIPKMIYESDPDDFDMNNIKVVPNPYLGTGAFEKIYQSQVNFINLPPAAKISIFSMTGDLIQTIMHTDGTDAENWNLLTRNDQSVVSGLYIYVVESKDDSFVGKFVVVR